MITDNNHRNDRGSRRDYVLLLLCQIIGISMFVGLANNAVSVGATGYMLVFMIISLFIGIPILYMEFITSQFTARDCIDVWKARPCVAHVGYILIFWQVIQILYNHVLNAFVFHYLLISFENPIPYYKCGEWTTEYCNIIANNFTVNDDCLRLEQPPKYCDHLYTTFPEYQYWRYKMMGVRSDTVYYVAWRVCLASALICAIMYLSITRQQRSIKWAVQVFTLYPIAGYVVLLMGSMLQKGVVVRYDDAMDSDFRDFFSKFRFSQFIVNMVLCLGLGTGTNFNLSYKNSFREPVYANTVVVVVIMIGIAILAISITAMMSCPYAFEYAIDPDIISDVPMSLLYEKTPRFLHEYRQKYFYLVLVYSSHTALGTGTNVIYVIQMVDMAVARSTKVAKYPGFWAFCGILCIFLVTIPLLSSNGVKLLVQLKLHSCSLAVFVVAVELTVFVIWYGVDKFSEDVHFMLGLQPKSYMKICWVVSPVILIYTFCRETYEQRWNKSSHMIDIVSWCLATGSAGLIVIIFVLQLLIGACRKKFHDVSKLNVCWGPKSGVLQRSRAMFTAQAMTKEYLYRQYHLQAGILARQKISNCRST